MARSAASQQGGERRRPSLGRAAIVRAALKLVDRHGVEALSMRRLAEELGVGTMSLYHHVANKEDLLDGVVELVLTEVEFPPDDAGPWDERALMAASSFRQVAHRHPNCVPLLVTRPYKTPGALRPLEASFELLHEAGFEPETAVVAYRAVMAYLLGFLTTESEGFFCGVGVSQDRQQLLDAGLPRLAALAPLLAERNADADFDAGLRIVRLGILRSLASRPPGHAEAG